MHCPRDWELTAIMKTRVPQKVRKSEIWAFGRQSCTVLLSAKFLLTCIQTELVVHICDKVKKQTSPVLHALHAYVLSKGSCRPSKGSPKCGHFGRGGDWGLPICRRGAHFLIFDASGCCHNQVPFQSMFNTKWVTYVKKYTYTIFPPPLAFISNLAWWTRRFFESQV